MKLVAAILGRWSILRSSMALFLLAWLAVPGAARAQVELSAAVVSEEMVPRGAEWRFFRGRTEPSGGTLDWTLPGFDDRAWETGAAGFGYGDGDDATILDEIARSNVGAVPSFDDVATGSHEAGTPEVFSLPDAGALLVAGSNVLAVIGLNDGVGGSDFSVHPVLRAGGLVAEGCPGDFYVAGSRVALAGKAPSPPTSEVRVNGLPATFQPSTGDWSWAGAIAGGSLSLTAEALDAGGGALARVTLKAIRARTWSGELASSTTWRAADGSHVVVGQVTVLSGVRLTIEAGCEILIRPEVGFTIRGEVQARGTSASPIRFTSLPCQENWGHFQFNDSLGENVFKLCEWSQSLGDPGCLALTDSNLELDGCALRDIDGEGVHAFQCKTRIRNCLTERTKEAFSLNHGDTVVEFCTVRDAIGKSDLIDANGSEDPPARIAFNHLHGTTDDGIDVDGGSTIIEGNIIHDCGDQAMSLVGTGTSTVTRNICYRNTHGLSVKNSHVCFADFNTFALNTETGVRAIEKTDGRGGGIITLKNSIIWANATQLLVESGGTIDVSYCDVEGDIVPGTGNINLDPLFAGAAAGDFRLQEGSPCIGAAEGGSDMGALPFELAPLAPSDLIAATASLDSVALSWRDNSSVEEGFELERAAADGDFGLVATLPADSHGSSDPGLAQGETYRYRVRAFNALGKSAYSNISSATTEVLLEPEILSIEPAEGPTAGGTAVVIRGRNFQGEVAASIGGAPFEALVVTSREEIQAVTPAGTRGKADLAVRTPGGEAVLSGTFTYFDSYARGDANGDGRRDLSDAVSILAFLFQGGAAPPCKSVADSNGDAKQDIADAIFLLLYLFDGGSAPDPEPVHCSS